jgi:hypothetical protein
VGCPFDRTGGVVSPGGPDAVASNRSTFAVVAGLLTALFTNRPAWLTVNPA